MALVKSYFIEKKMIFMMGEYNPFGKLCTRVLTGPSALLVDRTPLQLLNDTLTNLGFDFRGALIGAKTVLDKKAICPIIVNPYLGICLFPTKSPHKNDCIWFNPDQIVRTCALGNKTKVELSNGYYIMVDSKLSTFNDKIQKAQQLITLSTKRGIHPNPVSYDNAPKNHHQLTKGKSGTYNFNELEEQQNKKPNQNDIND